ncbi:MAG: filamentous hemagglutinin N-terminal domain-containing protein, partial [Paracoccaceae bacterium]
MARRRGVGRLAGGAATALALAALSGGPAAAEPRGGAVVAGEAAIETRGGTTTIRQGGRRVVIDWESFDIDADEAVRFVQPSRDAVALNRVLDGLPTHIRGRLLANGNVWLVNPSGVYFHAGSVVDVGGLIATTADIGNDRFMAGGGRFDRPGDPDARIVNEGRITFAEAGLAGFVAPHVENRGVIEGRLGRIVMAGREGFSVEVSGDGLFEIDVEDAAPGLSSRVENLGRLAAEGGTVVLTASAVRDAVAAAVHAGGVIEATRARRADDGAIVLDAGDGRLEIAGEISARGTGEARGGRIDATGRAVDVAAGARLDASGEAGGGRVRLGGDAGGPGDLVPAETVAVAAGARVAADALDAGPGGEVLVWSERATEVAGTLSVRGGPAGGDGGFVEMSSAGGVGFSGRVALDAPLGRPGAVRFDPVDLVISAGSGDPVGGDVAAGDPPTTLTLLAASLETIGGAVTLEATNDVIVEAGVSVVNPDPAASLTLRAGEDVVVAGALDFAGGLTLVADGIAPDGVGAIRIAGDARLVSRGVLGLSAPQGIDGAGMGAGATLTLGARADLTLPETTLAGALDVRVLGVGALTLGGDLAAASARLAAWDGIFGSGGIATSGDLTLDASRIDPVDTQTSFANVTPTGALSVGGRLSAVGDTVALRATGDLRLEDAFGRTALEIAAGGALTAARIASDNAFGAVSTGRVLLTAGDDVAVSDLRAGALTVGGPGSTSTAATPLPGNLRLERAVVGGPVRLRADGAATLEDVSARAGLLEVGGDALIRRAIHDGTLSLTVGGAATLDGLRADGLTATAASLALAQVATGTLAATATTGSVVVAPEVASGDLAGGFTIVAAPPELPRTFAGDAPLLSPSVSGAAIGALLQVTGDAVLAAAGDVTLTPGPVAGVEKAIVLPRLEAQARGTVSGRIAGDLALGPVEAAGVDLTSDGALTQTGLLNASGAARLTGADALTLGPIVAGSLTAESDGTIGQTAALSVTGATQVSTPDVVSLTQDNVFGGPVALSAASATIAAAGPLHLDDVQIVGDLFAVSGPGAVATTLDGATFETALRLERARIGGDAQLAAPGGVALSDLEAGSVTVGGLGSVPGAPTAAPGDVAVHRAVLDALTVAAGGAAGGIGGVRISDAMLAGDLSVAGAPRVGLSGVTLGRDAAFEPGAAPDGLSLERVATRGDLALDVAGDVSLALVDVRAGLATPGGLSIRTPGDVLKRPDADTDFAADGRFTLDLGAAGTREVAAPGPSGDLLGVAGATTIAAGGAILLPTAEDGAGGRRLRLAGPLSFEAAGDAVLSGAGPLAIAAGTVGGDAALGAAGAGEGLTQSGALSVAGALTLTVEGDAALGRADNAFASVSGDVAGRLTLRDADGFAVSDARLGGLGIAGQGGATPLRDVAATGDVSVSADAVSAERVAAGGALTLVSGGGFAASDLVSGGTATLRADGDLSALRFDFGTLAAETTGALALSDGAAGGAATLGAGSSAALSGVRFADATLSATEVTLTGVSAASLAASATAGDVTLAGVAAGGTLTLRASGEVRGAPAPAEIAAVTVAGARAATVGVATGPRLGDPAGGLTADLPAEGGRVLTAEALAHLAAAGGAARIEAGGGVALGTEPGGARVSRFGGPLSLEAGADATVHAAGPVTLGPSAIGGDLALRSGADGAAPGGTAGIGQVGDVSVIGRAGFETGAPGAPEAARADVTLDRPGNRFSNVTVTARDLTLRDADGFALVDGSLTRTLSVGGGTAQAGDVTLRDLSGFDASVEVAGTLQATTTRLTGRATLVAGDAALTDVAVDALAVAARRDLTAERLDGASATLTAGRNIALDDLRVTATTASADAALSLSDLSGAEVEAVAGGAATLSRLAVAGAVSVAAGGPATLTDLAAGGLDARSDGALSLTRISSGAATLTAATGATLEDVSTGTGTTALVVAGGDATLERTAAGDLTATVAGDLTALDLAVRSLAAEVGGDARGERLTAAGAAALTAGGAAETRDLVAGGPLSLSAGTRLTALRTVADGDAALASGEGAILRRAEIGGTLAATADLDGSAGGEALRLREVRAGALTAETGGTQDLDAVAVAGATSLLARDGAIRLGAVETGGTLKAVALSGAIVTQPGSARAPALRGPPPAPPPRPRRTPGPAPGPAAGRSRPTAPPPSPSRRSRRR